MGAVEPPTGSASDTASTAGSVNKILNDVGLNILHINQAQAKISR